MSARAAMAVQAQPGDFDGATLNGGRWEGRQLISADWIRRSVSPHANARPDTDYGYFWWLQTFQVAGRPVKSWGMYGTGGNKVYVLPGQDAVIVVTTTNYRVPHAGDLTDKLFTALLVPALGDEPAPLSH